MSTDGFRPLNEREKAVIGAAYGKGHILLDNPLTSTGELYVSYEFMQGGFCVCIVMQIIVASGFRLWRGASRRSYKDRHNPVRGQMRAFSRAVLYSRPVEI